MQCKAFNLLSHEEPEKIELTEKNTSDGERERGITNNTVQAFLIRDNAVVRANLHNIGTVTITISNSAGDVVCTTSVNTIIPVTLNLPLPKEDSYFIEIFSVRYRASGFFNF